MKKIALALIAISNLISCQKQMADDLPTEIPVSIASAAETSEIVETVLEIQKIGQELGLRAEFEKFPIRVVESYPGPGDASAYCQQDKKGNGIYIGILKSTLETYQNTYKPISGNSTLFLLLVHEFGHCLFKRDHDDEVISVTGLNFYFRSQQKDPESYNLVGGEIRVSAMTRSVYGSASIYLPAGIKEYYVAEMGGLRRWRNKIDLENTRDLKVGRLSP